MSGMVWTSLSQLIVVLWPESTCCLEGEQSGIKGHILNSSVYCQLNTNISQFAEEKIGTK